MIHSIVILLHSFQFIQKAPLILAKDVRIVREQHSMEQYVNEQKSIHNMQQKIDEITMDNILLLML